MARKSTRRNSWAGWGKLQPRGRQRRTMRRKCGKKCFLGPRDDPTGFPICAVYGDRISCDPNDKGLWAAYIRARQMSSKGYRRRRHSRRVYDRIARDATRMLKERGQWRGRGGAGHLPDSHHKADLDIGPGGPTHSSSGPLPDSHHQVDFDIHKAEGAAGPHSTSK